MRRIAIYISFIFLISCTGTDSFFGKNLSGGYKFHYNELGFPTIYRDSISYKYIPTWVFDYSFNDDYIIASSKDCAVCNLDTEHPVEYVNYANDCYDLLDDIEYSYWIITHNQDSVYGPFSTEEYLIRRKVLGVPDELMLKFEK